MEEECNLFRDTIEDLNMVDINLGQGSFTWNNKMKGDRHIYSHLHRYLVYESVMELGSKIHSSTLLDVGSNHWPIELWWSGLDLQFKNTFRFEQLWLGYPNFKEKVYQW